MTTLQRTRTALRLQALRTERTRLLREVGRRKAALESWRSGRASLLAEFRAEALPLEQVLCQRSDALRRAFAELLSDTGPLERRERARLRRAVSTLMEALGPEGGAGHEHDAERETASAAKRQRARELPGAESTISADAGGSGRLDPARVPNARAVFRRLVIALHPDKVQDESEKAERTELMKELTLAFEHDDIARLVDLESTWLVDLQSVRASSELSGEECYQAQLQENRELRKQLRSLTAEVKDVKRGLGDSVRGATPDALRSQLEQWLTEPRAAANALGELLQRCAELATKRIDLMAFVVALQSPGKRVSQGEPAEVGLELPALCRVLHERQTGPSHQKC